MSTTVDQRVVEMRFDNQNFERNVRTSMSTLDKLKQKLNFKGASKGLEEINSEAKKCNLSPLSAAAEGVKVKFSAMEVMAVTALSNITNSAVNAGKRMISALTIDPIKTGFDEYETQINAVQTILANTKSKGSTLDDVNSALKELNDYADKTIYNFTEMTRNIGTFTAAGIELDTSVSAIQGIANLAAISGSTSQQASTAMYQLSQALASGTVKLMDWNSVVNAGMGGEIFQEALKKTSEELQTGAAAAIEAEGSFRESLSTGWLTAEVLTETLKKFTTSGANEYVAEYTGLSKEAVETALKEAKAKYGEADAIAYASKALAEKSGKNEEEIRSVLDMASTAEDAATKVKTFSQLWDTMKEAVQSGWTQTWQLIIGDFEQAKELLTGISDFFGKIIEKMSNARNDVLAGALGRTFSDLKEKINGVLAPAKKAVDTVNKVKDSVSDLGDVVNDVILGKFGNSQERFDKLTKSGQNYYRVQNKVNETLGNAFRYTEEQIEAQDKLLGVHSKVVDGTSEETAETEKLTDEKKKLIKKIASMTEAEMRAKGYTDKQIEAFKELGRTADKLGMPLDEFIDKMDEIDGRWLLIDSFKSIGKGLIEVFNAIGQAWKNVFPSTIDDKADTLFNIIAAFHRFSRGVLTAATENADEFRRTFEGLFAILDLVRMVAGGALGFAFKILNAILSSLNLNILDVTAGIGDAIVAFRDWVKEHDFVTKAIEKLASFFVKSFIAVRDFVKMVLEIPEVQGAITKFKDACEDVFSNVGDFFSEGGKRIQEFIDRVKAMDSLTLADLGKIFEDFRKNVLGYFFNFDGIFENVKNALSKFRDKIYDCFGSIGEKLGWVKDKLSGLIDFIKTNIPSIVAMVMGFGIIKALKKIGDALDVIADPIRGLSDVLEKAATVLNSFAGYINAKAFETKSNAVLKLALALGVLTACIIALTLVDPDKLWTAVGALAALMGVLAVFTLLITLIGKLGSADPNSVGKGLNTVALSMLGMAISLSILVDSLKKMESLNADKIGTSLAVLAGMAVGLVTLSVALSRLGGKSSIASAASMVAIALALKMMVGVLEDLGSLNFGQSLIALGLLFGILAAFKLVLKSCNGVNAGAALTLIGIVIALKMTIGAIETLGEMDPKTITNGLVAIIPILAIFSLVMAASKLAGQNAAKAGVGILAMSVAIVVLMHAMKQLSGMNQSELDKGLKTVATLLALFGAIVALSYFAGKNAAKAGAMLLMMSGAILILTGVIWALQAVPSEGLNRALGAITVMGVIFGVLIAVSKLAVGSKGVILALTIAAVALAAVVMALSILDPSAMTRATIALDSIIAMLALLIFALSTIKKGNVGSAIGAVLALTLVVIALAAVLGAMTFLSNTDALIPAAVSLSLLLLAFSTALVILSKVGRISANTIGSAYAFSGIVAILAIILGAMTFLPNPQPLIPIAGSLSILLLAFSGALFILSKASPIAAQTMGAAYAMVGITVILGAILSAMSFLPNPEPLIPTSIALAILLNGFASALLILSKSGTIAAQTMGAAAAMAGITVILGAILSAMSFLPNPEPLIPTSIALTILLNGLASALLILSIAGPIAAQNMGAAAAMAGITAILGTILAVMANYVADPIALIPIATSLVILLNGLSAACLILGVVGTLGPAAFIGIGVLSALIAAMAIIIGGLGALVTKFPDLETFLNTGLPLLEKIGTGLGNFLGGIVGGVFEGIAASLPAIGTSLSQFMVNLDPFLRMANSVDPKAMEGIKSLASAILILTAADVLDGLTSWFTGGTSISDFAKELTPVGEGLAGFGNALNGVNTKSIKDGADGLKAICEAAQSIPNEGGILAEIVGDNGIAPFARQLPLLGNNLTQFSDSVANMSLENIQNGANALITVAEAANKIPNEGGILAEIVGDNGIAPFARQLPLLGNNLTQFSDSVANMSLENVENGGKGLVTIANAANKIPNEGGILAEIVGDNGIAPFARQLPLLGNNLTQFSDSVANMNLKNVENGGKGLVDIATAAHSIPNTGGILSKIFGDNDAATFGDKLRKLGEGIRDFATNAGGVEQSVMTASTTALQTLINTTKTIPEGGDWIGRLFGTDNMSVFKDDLGTLGSAISDFSKNAGDVNLETVNAASKAVTMLSDISNYTSSANSDKLATFGSDLKTFGSHLKAYYDGMSNISDDTINISTKAVDAVKGVSSGINSEQVSVAVSSVKKLIDMTKDMASVDAESTSGFVTAMNNLAKSGITGFVNTFSAASSRISEVGKNVITKLVDGAKSQESKIKQIGNSLMNKLITEMQRHEPNIGKLAMTVFGTFNKNIKLQQSKMATSGKDLIKKFADGISKQISSVSKLGKSMIAKFVDEITKYESKAKTAAKNIVVACNKELKNGATSAKLAGKNFVIGFANGISENTFKAQAQARAMAKAALDAAEDALDINSPSKETYQIGDYFGKGFVNAIDDYRSKSYNTAYGMAEYARKGLSGAISKINDVVNGDFDTQPTIRPVIDLTNVESGADAINSMLNRTPSVGVMSDVRSIGSMMTWQSQNGTNDDVVSAIRDLSDKLSGSSGDSYSINGITYDDGTNVSNAVKTLVRAARVGRRR